jgi:hypothetical protein
MFRTVAPFTPTSEKSCIATWDVALPIISAAAEARRKAKIVTLWIVAVALSLIVLLSAGVAFAKPPKLGIYRMPETVLVCGKDCRDRVRLARTMDDIAAGKLQVCKYREEHAIWVRKRGGSGDECWKVVIPQNRLTGWRR